MAAPALERSIAPVLSCAAFRGSGGQNGGTHGRGHRIFGSGVVPAIDAPGGDGDPAMSLVIANARAVDARGEREDAWVLVEGSRIASVGVGLAPDAGVVVDAHGGWLTPGFIDLHEHGGAGVSFDDDDSAAFTDALAVHRAHGTTRSVLSLVANPVDKLERSLGRIADVAERDPLVWGAHLEGPFLSRSRAGAHNPSFLRPPTPDAVERLIAAARGTIAQVTLAPELPGALEAVDAFVGAGAVVAVGHTDATEDQARAAFDRGARLLTHAFNAMPGIHHREPGPVVAAFEDERVILELILDGVHVHPHVARLAFARAGGRIALVTDAMSATGARDAEYALGSLEVTVSDGVARVTGTDTIAGSTLTQDAALRRAVREVGLGVPAAVEALTLTPARALGRDDRHGLLAPGHAADLVLLDAEWHVQTVWAEGQQIA